MQNQELPKAEQFRTQHSRRRVWKRIVGALACVVVFCTVYALILPAITMEPEPVCGLQEHSHDESCYSLETAVFEAQLSCLTAQMLHQHTYDCYDAAGKLICGQADFVIHYHDAACYDSAGNLVCPLPEIGEHVHTEACFAGSGHVHTDACYETQDTLICGLEETEEHAHDETCYETSEVLICGESESDPELLCGMEEVIPHIHEPSCYDAAGNRVCGRLEIRVHQHDANCMTKVEIAPERSVLTCSLPEHTHTTDCYPQHSDEPEDEVSTEPEYPVYCGKEAHEHTDVCYQDGSIVCGLEAHAHSEACWEPPVEDEADPTADLETSADWEASMAGVTLTGEYRTDVLAIAESQLGYTASVRNYIVDETGREKRLSRYGQWYGDAYGDWCAMFVSFCLHYGDVEEMPLEANCQRWMTALSQQDCDLLRDSGPWADANWEPEADPEHSEQTLPAYTPLPGDLVFFDYEGDGISDHVALVYAVEEATDTEPARLTTIERAPGDQVGYRTYSLPYGAIAGFGTLPEQTFYCGKAGHVHTQACSAACSLEEHIHTEDCEKQPDELLEEGKLTRLEAAGEDYVVSVLYGPEAALPDGVTLSVREILPGTEEYQTYYDQSQAALATGQEEPETLTFARFFDIQFLLDGQVIEPASPVHVTITYASDVETEAATGCWAIHFAESGTELLDAEATVPEEGGTSFSHTQEGFSVVGNLVTAVYGANATDVGPDVLPVDYYVHIDGQWVCVGSTKTGWYGDYTATKWENTNRDCITVAQANSILGPYGFEPNAGNAALQIAYQRKETYLEGKLHCDTLSYSASDGSGAVFIPLARNKNPRSGYNIYFIPGNTNNNLSNTLETIPTVGSDFYTVSIYDASGNLLHKSNPPVRTGRSYTWTVDGSDAASWLAAYSDGHTETVSVTESSLTLSNITSTVTLSPARGDEGSCSVTFKVLVDGQWKTVGSLPYYYTSDGKACITTDMATQFFGSYGYVADAATTGNFAFSYNDIYTIFYANGSTKTNFCMDVAGGTLQEAQVVQLYKSNGSDAQVFRIRDAGNGYSFISPIGNSSFFVNVYGFTTGDPSSTQLKLSQATNENSQWKVDTGSDGRTTFWSAIAPTDLVIDLDNANMANTGKLQVWHSNGGAHYWFLEQQFRVSSSTSAGDGTIGSNLETNGNIVCYYMPVAATENFANLSEADAAQKSGGSWYSVTVVDDTHAVYSDVELQALAQNVLSGTGVTVTVRNADGILWSCRGLGDTPLEVESTQANGQTTFTIQSVNQPVEIVATQADPDFTVQYYCNIPRFATSGERSLTVIDTSGKALPTNGGTMKTKPLYLEAIGQNTNQNNGDSTPLYRVKTQLELTKLYSDGIFQFETSPGMDYFNKLKDNESYTLAEIWVLKDGKKSTSLNLEDWDVYPYTSDIAFTNEASQAAGNTILVEDGTVIRLVSNTSTGQYHNGTTFYDYNISSGQNADGRWRTGITGINSKENYGTSGNGQRNWDSGVDVLAFGNANCGTGMALYQFDGGTLNKYNALNSNYGGTSFEIAAGLNADGTIRYNGWIVAPKLFNEGDAQYKQTYSGSSLTFERVGDTYTLSAATLNNSNGQSNTLSGLEYFFNPSPIGGTVHSHIFTNNFWPMDPAAGRTDALWGAYGNPGKFQGFAEGGNPTSGWSDNAADFPVGDDGRAHNWFFGMNFAISFSLTADYEGPLEYYFFGDDDLWVFLDQKLVCDIGGVHSSVGEYVNLRDYLPVGSSGQHTLSFFYTERGDTGSTCYMSFTLPSVSSATTSRDTGSLQIQKSVEGIGSADFSGEEYKFQVELLTSENGSPLNQTFSYSRTDGANTNYGTLKSGGTIVLHQNESATISGIPAGTYYRVTELTTAGYHTTVNGNVGYIVSGKIETGTVKPASFVNTVYHELPETGGSGTYLYTIPGAAALLMAAILLVRKLRRRREVISPD